MKVSSLLLSYQALKSILIFPTLSKISKIFTMMKYVIVVLALIAVASAQLIYSGVSGPSFHNAFASSAQTGIRRYGSTAGYAYAPAGFGYAAAPAYYY